MCLTQLSHFLMPAYETMTACAIFEGRFFPWPVLWLYAIICASFPRPGSAISKLWYSSRFATPCWTTTGSTLAIGGCWCCDGASGRVWGDKPCYGSRGFLERFNHAAWSCSGLRHFPRSCTSQNRPSSSIKLLPDTNHSANCTTSQACPWAWQRFFQGRGKAALAAVSRNKITKRQQRIWDGWWYVLSCCFEIEKEQIGDDT